MARRRERMGYRIPRRFSWRKQVGSGRWRRKPGFVSRPGSEQFFVVAAAAGAPVISPNGGSFATFPDVTLSGASTILYTVGGTVPGANSAVYAQPIHLTQNAVGSARGFSCRRGGGASVAAV